MTITDEIPLARPVLGEAEEQAVLDVLRSGQLSLGPRVPAFEAAFAARLGAVHASAVSSGTTGLHLALRAVGVGPGDEVVTSPFSFVASANAVLYEQARPVFADIDPVTLNLDPRAAEAAITQVHPHLGVVELVNFKVRILDEAHGTDAVTRVFIDASDGAEVWGSTGVHANVIAASWQALVDSLEFAEQPDAARLRPS